MKVRRIAIVGAGVAGLTAAREFAQAGHDVHVFEKSRGLGGRAGTRRLPWGEVDIGVQYFTARDERFQQQVETWRRRRQLSEWQFTPYIYDRSKNDASELTPSPDNTKRYVGMPGMRVLARDLGVETLVHYSQKVIALERQVKGWRLMTESGPFEYFDWVICAQPVEQTRELLSGHSDMFKRLPADVHNQCWALVLATKGRVPHAVQGVFSRDNVSWLTRSSARPGYDRSTLAPQGIDDVWLLHFSPKWSAQQGKHLPAEQLIAEGGRWLNRLLARCGSSPVAIVHSNTHFWRYAQVCSPWLEQAKGDVFIDSGNHLAAIGAWCTSGRYEDGFLSGLKIAEKIK